LLFIDEHQLYNEDPLDVNEDKGGFIERLPPGLTWKTFSSNSPSLELNAHRHTPI